MLPRKRGLTDQIGKHYPTGRPPRGSSSSPQRDCQTASTFIPVWGWAGGLWRCNPCVTPKPAVAFSGVCIPRSQQLPASGFLGSSSLALHKGVFIQPAVRMGFPEIVDPKDPTFQEHQTGRSICWTSTKSLDADGGGPMATIGPAGALGPCGETQAHNQVLFLGIVLKRSRWVFVEGRCLGGNRLERIKSANQWTSSDPDASVRRSRSWYCPFRINLILKSVAKTNQ